MTQLAADQIRDIHYVVPTDDLDAKLNAAVSGDIFILMEGTYTVNAQIDFTGKSRISVIGSPGSIINSTITTASTFLLNNCSDILLQGFEITTAWGPASDGQVIAISGASNIERVTIRGIKCNINPVGNDSYFFGSLAGGFSGYLQDITIEGCNVFGKVDALIRITSTNATGALRVNAINNTVRGNGVNGAFGVTMTNANVGFFYDSLILGNLFDNIFVGIYLDDVKECLISNNIIRDGGSTVAHHGVWVQSNSANVTIEGNIVKSQTGSGVNTLAPDCVLVGNILSLCGDYGIFSSGGRCVFAGNKIYDPGNAGLVANGIECVATGNRIYSTTGVGLSIAGARSCAAGNDIVDTTSTGIAAGGFNSVVCGNTIHNTGQQGILISGTESVVSGNMCYGTTGPAGIDVAGGDNCVVVGNFTYASVVGIRTAGTSGYCVVCGNAVMDPTGDGIALQGASCIAVGNVIDSAGDAGITIATNCMAASNFINNSTGNGIEMTGIESSAVGNKIWGGVDGITVSLTKCFVASNYISDVSGDGVTSVVAATFLTVVGNYIDSAATYGVEIRGTNSLVASNHAYDIGAHCFFCSASDSVFNGNYAYSPSGYGFQISSTTRVLVAGNYVYDSVSSGIYCVGSLINVVGNLVYSTGSNGIDFGVSYGLVSSNIVQASGDDDIHVTGAACQVIGNVSFDATNEGIDIGATSDYSTVQGNHVYSPGGGGIEVSGQNCQVVGNYVSQWGAAASGIEILAPSCAVQANYCDGGGIAGRGIYVNAGNANSVIGNFIYLCLLEGILVNNSDYPCIVGNAVHQCDGSGTTDGISITGGSIRATISANTIIGNAARHQNAIHIGASEQYASVVGNAIGNCDLRGIYSEGLASVIVGNWISSPSNNEAIYHNRGTGDRNSIIAMNSIYAPGTVGIRVNSRYVVVAYNSMDSCPSYSIQLEANAGWSQVSGNYITNGTDHGIYTLDCEELQIVGNYIRTLTGTTKTGIYVDDGDYHMICNNKVAIVTGDGIYVLDSVSCMISNNHVRAAASDGIDLDNVDESAINGNRLTGNTQYGIDEDANCDQNLYGVNHVRGNTAGAVNLAGTNRSQFGNKS